MNFFGINIPSPFGSRTRTVIHDFSNLDKHQPKGSDIRYAAKIYEQPVYRTRRDIHHWRTALMAAENPQNPQRFLLLNLYQEIVLDAQLSAAIQSRKIKTLSRPFRVVDDDHKELPEMTALFTRPWFRRFMDLALDVPYWGFSLVQFGDIAGDEFTWIEEVSRANVKPEFGIVTAQPSDMEGVQYEAAPYNNWCLFIGGRRDLGLLNKATPLVIWKKNAMGAWSEYQELFGMPFRHGRTNIRDEALLKNMSEMMANMGRAAWGVFDINDSVEFVYPHHPGNASAIYLDMQEYIDRQLSKLVFGQTMTADSGSSRSQAEVHENVANEYASADQRFIESVVNTRLIPMMVRLGFPLEGLHWQFDNTENRTAAEQWQIDSGLLQHYTLPPEYIAQKYGSPVEKK